MVNLLKSIVDGITKVQELVEHDTLDEEKFPLGIFRYDSGVVEDLVDELNEAIALNKES